MAIIECKRCGGELILVEGSSTAQCEYCGRTQTVPKADDEKKIMQFERAERLRKLCEFDKAAGIYEAIVADFPREAEAYWGLVLCKFGIEYVDDPATGEKVPTCHRSGFDSVLKDKDFELALENADIVARRIYREEAKAIEELRKSIVAVSANERPYDIFICYKETDENGNRTLDSVLAQDVYDALTDKGYRVFFARITLEDKLGQEYEPYIFAALHSAKVMLTFGTDYEYFNAVWVKNEWSRFLKLMATDKDKHLIPCYKGIDAYDMPEEFARLQAQDLGKMGAIQDILRGIEKLIPREKAAPAQQSVTGSSPNVESLLRRGQLFLEDKDWKSADEYFDKVLDIAPECADAYVGKVCAQMHYGDISAIAQESDADLGSNPNVTKAMRFGDAQLQKRLKDYLEQSRVRKKEKRDRSVYELLCGHLQNDRTPEALRSTAERFAALGDYPGAAAKAQQCLEKAQQLQQEAARRAEAEKKRRQEQQEKDYAAACGLLEKAESISQLQEVADKFLLLAGYRDALQQKKAAEEKILVLLAAQKAEEEARRQAEQLRLEQEQKRLAEEAAARAAKRKKTLTVTLISVAAAIVVLVAGALIATKIARENGYRDVYAAGVAHYEAEEYFLAGECFSQLVRGCDFRKISGIEDSDKWLSKSLADAAMRSFQLSNLNGLMTLQNHPSDWSLEEYDLLFDIYYDAAQLCVAEEVYNGALFFLNTIKDSRDVAQQTKECYYKAAEQYLQEGDLLSAASNFEKAEDYTDAVQRAKETRYTYGTQRLEEGLYGAAYDTLKELGDYENSAMLTKYCLVMGNKAMENLISAEDLLAELPDDFKNVAELKKQIEILKPYAGSYECTSYSGGLYEKGVNKNSKVYQKYYYMNIVPKLMQLDKNSNELTLVVVLECCNERKAVQKSYIIRDLEMFQKKQFSYKLVLDEDDGKVVEWIDLTFTKGTVKLDTHDASYSTYDEVRKHTFCVTE